MIIKNKKSIQQSKLTPSIYLAQVNPLIRYLFYT